MALDEMGGKADIRTMELREDHTLRASMTVMGEAARTVYVDEAADPEAVKAAYCDAINLMRARGWPPERALMYCKRLSDADGLSRVDAPGERNRRTILQSRIVHWLVECYFNG